jgi:ribonuclease HII
MRQWDRVFPQYGLARHKGYDTPEHQRALQLHGPTPLHRMSFEPVRARSLFPWETDPRQMDLFVMEAGA